MAPGTDSARLPQHPDEHRPERPILLAVDQQLGEGPRLRVPVELADPVGPVEVGERQDVEQFGAVTPQYWALLALKALYSWFRPGTHQCPYAPDRELSSLVE